MPSQADIFVNIFQNKLRQVALMKDKMKKTQRDENQLEKLRLKFVEQAKMYLGVPYARRYHEPGSKFQEVANKMTTF